VKFFWHFISIAELIVLVGGCSIEQPTSSVMQDHPGLNDKIEKIAGTAAINAGNS
jgi:hypothetical protein